MIERATAAPEAIRHPGRAAVRGRLPRRRLARAAVVLALLATGCGEAAARVGTDAGPLDTVTAVGPSTEPSPGTDPQAPGTTTPPSPDSPPEPSSPSTEQPSDQATSDATEQPSDDATSDPSEDASEVEPAPPDLELPTWDLRVVGVIDPARADVLNVFTQRPVVVVLHAQADAAPTDADDEPADDAVVVDVVRVELELDSGQRVDELGVFTGATTVECPAQVERRVLLRAGQGQRTCAVFDVPGTAEVAAVSVASGGTQATVAADGLQVSSIDATEALDIGVPESTLALGEAVEVTLDTAVGDAAVDLAVTAAEVVEEGEDGRLVGITVEVSSATDLFDVRFGPEMVAALSPDGVQRTRLLDATSADCRGTASVDVPAGEAVSFCVPILVPDDAITSHARFFRVDGPPQVWRVLQAGGTAGPGSNA